MMVAIAEDILATFNQHQARGGLAIIIQAAGVGLGVGLVPANSAARTSHQHGSAGANWFHEHVIASSIG